MSHRPPFLSPLFRRYYPDPHPVHGVQLMRVGKLQHYLERIEDALDTFKQVRGIKESTSVTPISSMMFLSELITEDQTAWVII